MPPDSPTHLTTQPAPLAIHPPIHPAPPATIHPLSPTHIPLALLPTPMPEAYVLNWAAHYVTGSSNPSPPKTLSVLDTHSVRSTPPVTPPLTFTETDVFIVRMVDEPGEPPSSSSYVFPRIDHEDEAPPTSNPASAPASDFDQSECDSDSSSHGSSHAQTSACSYFFPSTNLWSRARYAFSAASRSYSLAVFKKIDNSPDLIRRRATRVVTDARSKFGLDLHARHSRRVNKSRRTYNDNLDSAPISLPPSAGGSYENSEDEASLRGGEARTPEFAPEYSPSDTPSVPPGPPRRAFNPEQGHLFSYPISAAPAERAAPPLIPPISSLPATAPPAYSGLLSPHLRPSTPAPYPPQTLILGWIVDTMLSTRGMTPTAISRPMPPFRVPDRNPSPPQFRVRVRVRACPPYAGNRHNSTRAGNRHNSTRACNRHNSTRACTRRSPIRTYSYGATPR